MEIRGVVLVPIPNCCEVNSTDILIENGIEVRKSICCRKVKLKMKKLSKNKKGASSTQIFDINRFFAH